MPRPGSRTLPSAHPPKTSTEISGEQRELVARLGVEGGIVADVIGEVIERSPEPRQRALLRALAEEAALVRALGGEEGCTPQRRALAGDAAILGMLVRLGTLGLLDPEEAEARGALPLDAARLGDLAQKRRAILQAASLDRVALDVPGLATYADEVGASPTNDSVTPDTAENRPGLASSGEDNPQQTSEGSGNAFRRPRIAQERRSDTDRTKA